MITHLSARLLRQLIAAQIWMIVDRTAVSAASGHAAGRTSAQIQHASADVDKHFDREP